MSNKGSVKCPRIIAMLLLIVLLIASITLLILNPYSEEYYKELINERWGIHPISKIEIIDKNNSLINDLESIDYNGKKEIKYWNGKGFKITKNINLDYIKLSKKNSKKCGIDNFANELYVNENEECPINYIYISTSQPNILFNYESISLGNGKTLYYSNQNINGRIFVNINVGGIYGCGICYYLDDYCENKVNFDLCKYKDNSSLIIDSLTINDYVKDNDLDSTQYGDKEIYLYAESYSALKNSFTYSNLNGLKKIKFQQKIYNIFNIIVLIISFIIISLLMYNDTNYGNKCCSIILNIINLVLLIIDIIISIKSILKYNKFGSNIIPYISHPLREDYLTRKKWIEFDFAILIFLIIYLIINFILTFIDIIKKEYTCGFVLFDYSRLLTCLQSFVSFEPTNNFNYFYCGYNIDIDTIFRIIFQSTRIKRFFFEINQTLNHITNFDVLLEKKNDQTFNKKEKSILVNNYLKIFDYTIKVGNNN